jgi:23S rRNA pseudouridine1911/1915/1917 synthase
MRLDLALIRKHSDLSRRKAREAIEKGQVTVNGETVRDAGRAVGVEAEIAWDRNRPALPRARLSLPLLYRDDALIIIDKPAGLLSVPTASADNEREDTALARVREYVLRLHRKRPFVAAAHRLDRDTSGALVFALTPEMRESMRALFRAHRIDRRYLALIEGRPRPDSGVIELPIRDAYVAGRRGVARPGEPAKIARSSWRLVERFRGAALIEVELATGRQHQIRIHLAHVGHPVLGDSVYGDAERRPILRVKRQMLHARHLAFEHPISGQRIAVESPMPADFAATLSLLRRRT